MDGLVYRYDPKQPDSVIDRMFGETDGVASAYLVIYDDSCIDGDVVRPYVCQPTTLATTTDEDGERHIETLG